MDYNKIILELNKKKELLEEIKILDEEYYKICHNIILFPILVDLQYKKMIQTIKNKCIDSIIKINQSEKEDKVKQLICDYVKIEIVEKEKYDILRTEILDINHNLTLLKKNKINEENYELLKDY